MLNFIKENILDLPKVMSIRMLAVDSPKTMIKMEDDYLDTISCDEIKLDNHAQLRAQCIVKSNSF